MQTHRVLWLAVIVCTLALAGCGSSGGDTSSTPADDPAAVQPADAPADSQATASDVVSEAIDQCSVVTSRSQMAKDFGMSSTDPQELADRFARAYGPDADAVAAGCLPAIEAAGP